MKRMVVVASALAILAASCGSDEPALLSGMVREPPPNVANVSLPDASTGTATKTMPLSGDLLVLYFGYTSCPDVCPTTLADLRFALRSLGDEAERIEVAMVTVDPNRDDARRLADYVQSFVPGARAFRTDDDAELRAAANAFGVSYDVTEAEDGEIEVAHSAFLYVVDSQGFIRLQWPFGVPAEDIEADLAILLKQTA